MAVDHTGYDRSKLVQHPSMNSAYRNTCVCGGGQQFQSKIIQWLAQNVWTMHLQNSVHSMPVVAMSSVLVV
jgi:hypothetical protein